MEQSSSVHELGISLLGWRAVHTKVSNSSPKLDSWLSTYLVAKQLLGHSSTCVRVSSFRHCPVRGRAVWRACSINPSWPGHRRLHTRSAGCYRGLRGHCDRRRQGKLTPVLIVSGRRQTQRERSESRAYQLRIHMVDCVSKGLEWELVWRAGCGKGRRRRWLSCFDFPRRCRPGSIKPSD